MKISRVYFSLVAIGMVGTSVALNKLSMTNHSILACQNLSNIQTPESSTQVVVVQGAWDKVQAELTPCQKIADKWQPAFNSFPVVVGKNGIAKAGEKKEGDLKTPSGLYLIGEVFGYSNSLGKQLKMDYRYASPNKRDKFIDDPNSLQYNTWVTGPTDAKSFEYMHRDDNIYEIGAVINYNMYPVVKGAGSAIFMHIWRPARTGTAGCIAMDKTSLSRLLYWLDKNQNPQILIQGQ